jgi:hypothetical protein
MAGSFFEAFLLAMRLMFVRRVFLFSFVTQAPCGPIVYDCNLTFWAWLCSYLCGRGTDRRGRGRHRAGTPIQLMFSEIAQKRAR